MEPEASSPAAGIAAGLADFGIGLATSAFNVHEARQNRRFQRNMSNTAHQREMADMAKAGLNPILSAKGGPGASTPSGSSAQVAPQAPLSKMLESELMRAQVGQVHAQTADANSAAALKNEERNDMLLTRQNRLNLMIAQWRDTLQRADKTDLEKLNVQKQLEVLEKERDKLQLEISHSALDLERAKQEQHFHKGLGGKLAPYSRFLPWYNSLRR